MKKTSELPQAVNNLRAIWEKKKVEMQFTQVEAAKELGWSQGAISHYLNNITDLGTTATIKFANFLEVDPRDIDPTIVEHLPNVTTQIVRFNSNNATKRIDKPHYVREPECAFWIEINPDKTKMYTGSSSEALIRHLTPFDIMDGTSRILARVCPAKERPNAVTYLVSLKGEKQFHFYREQQLPPASKISKKLSVINVGYYPTTFS
jgi:transcriptional regulator with XRE-family HTH domain